MRGLSVEALGLVLLTACLVAIVSRKLRLPYSIGLVIAGIALALSPVGLELPLTRELIFSIFLPPLVFEAALQLEWRSFRRELPVTALLAFVGVGVATAVVAAGCHFLIGWSWAGASLFGVLIAATDPVSVIAAFKQMKAPPRLKMLVESESLLNDGVAAVGFAVLSAIAVGSGGTSLSIGVSLIWTVLGGVLVGGLVSGAALLIAGRTTDHLIEITLTTLAAYGSFLLAEHLGASGVLASLTAGLVVGNVGWMGAIADTSRSHVLAFWDYAAFLANSVVFILIGSHEAHQPFQLVSKPALIAVGLVLLGRAAAVYPLAAILHPTRLSIPLAKQHVLFWGGLRGALALALALALPANLLHRDEIIVTAFAVVAFSIFVQGLTMPWVIRRLGLTAAANPDGRPTGVSA